MTIINDVNEVSKKEDICILSNNQNYFPEKEKEKDPKKSVINYEIKKIIELFDKKKTIVIPKTEDFSKKNGNEKSAAKKENFSTLDLEYKQTEFVRPKNLIVYSEKNRLEPKENDFEASASELSFLNFESHFISKELFEKIISALENDVNKGEMIPAEHAKEIILNLIPDKKEYVDKIYKVIFSNFFFPINLNLNLKVTFYLKK
mgnify:CR=1 FL=1